MKNPIYIVGAGGLGREVLSLISSLDKWEAVGFIDDFAKPGTIVNGIKVVGGIEVIPSLAPAINVIIAIGDPIVKANLACKIKGNVSFPVLIHPSAILQAPSRINIGQGSIISAGAVLTTDIDVASHVLINLNATIGHDTKIGNFTSIMPGVNIAGSVVIGDKVLIGAGANIINSITVGDESRVGMGAVVIRSVLQRVTVAGVPAKPLEK